MELLTMRRRQREGNGIQSNQTYFPSPHLLVILKMGEGLSGPAPPTPLLPTGNLGPRNYKKGSFFGYGATCRFYVTRFQSDLKGRSIAKIKIKYHRLGLICETTQKYKFLFLLCFVPLKNRFYSLTRHFLSCDSLYYQSVLITSMTIKKLTQNVSDMMCGQRLIIEMLVRLENLYLLKIF